MVKIIKGIFDIIFIILIIILSLYLILKISNKIELYNVKTGSMEDNIHVGDYILIYKKNDYQIGDVVTFSKDGYFVTHRIIKKDNKKFVTKGDANNLEDDEITIDDIVGKVVLSGGFLNFVIDFKYALVAGFLSLYLLSCYFGKGSEEGNYEKGVKD